MHVNGTTEKWNDDVWSQHARMIRLGIDASGFARRDVERIRRWIIGFVNHSTGEINFREIVQGEGGGDGDVSDQYSHRAWQETAEELEMFINQASENPVSLTNGPQTKIIGIIKDFLF